jgi:hypothetical protein
MEKIQKFREDFAKIEAATEIDNFDELLRIFSKNEEKVSFNLFRTFKCSNSSIFKAMKSKSSSSKSPS